MRTADFDYDLPADRIAQTPLEPRDASRLLILDRKTGQISHSTFANLGEYLSEGDALAINQTRVIRARLFARKMPSGGRVELLLIQRKNPWVWESLVGGKGLKVGQRLKVDGGLEAAIVAELSGARRLIQFTNPIDDLLDELGEMPLPPYIHVPLEDPERYQTVYSRLSGSVAAPTAGLHFTPVLMDRLQRRGIKFIPLTLHVGLDTFAPVTEADPEQHMIHTEWCQIDQESAQMVNEVRKSGGRIIAVGTTSVRTLETAARLADLDKTIKPFECATDLFILPGFQFKLVDAMITNFHLPRSTLLMLVSAFAGRELILQAYQEAIEAGYRFYSFGDAMLIV